MKLSAKYLTGMAGAKMAMADFGLDATLGTLAYAQDDSLPVAAAKGIGEAAAWAALGPAGNFIQWGYMGAMAAGAVYQAGAKAWGNRMDQNYSVGRIGGNRGPFIDTNEALTMRQQALQSLNNSRVAGRMVLGNEASYLHR